jgi:hypothetical protein
MRPEHSVLPLIVVTACRTPSCDVPVLVDIEGDADISRQLAEINHGSILPDKGAG